MIAGGAAILAGVLAQTSGSRTTRSAGAVGVLGGGALLKSGLEKRAESNIHSLALEELGQSLDAEITPRVIELEDRTVRLTGNVEDQYDQWRELLPISTPQSSPHWNPRLRPPTACRPRLNRRTRDRP